MSYKKGVICGNFDVIHPGYIAMFKEMSENQNTTNTMSSFPPQTDRNAWREVLVGYYMTNAPEKVSMVTEAMLTKYEGKYESLFSQL